MVWPAAPHASMTVPTLTPTPTPNTTTKYHQHRHHPLPWQREKHPGLAHGPPRLHDGTNTNAKTKTKHQTQLPPTPPNTITTKNTDTSTTPYLEQRERHLGLARSPTRLHDGVVHYLSDLQAQRSHLFQNLERRRATMSTEQTHRICQPNKPTE